MHTQRLCSLVSVATILIPLNAMLSADSVRLRSGQAVDGSFVSADTRVMRMVLDNGRVAEFEVDTVAAVEFTPRPPAPPAPDPATAPPPFTIPMGTVLDVRLTEGIDVDAAQAGMTCKSLLDDPVMMNGGVVLPRGAAVQLQVVKVEQAGAFVGADRITLKANSIAFGGRTYDITTTQAESAGNGEGRRTARKVGGGAGLGAAIGAIAGGGKGAAIGALAGGATGAIVASQGTEHLKLPAETRLRFTLNAAVTVRSAE
jgi:hypothetical protein